MFASERNRLSSQDWILVVLCCLAGVGVSALALWIVFNTLLAQSFLQERGLRTNRTVRLMEKVLETTPVNRLPSGVITIGSWAAFRWPRVFSSRWS
jgi:hypothetical protein